MYVSGFVAPVPEGNKEAYRKMAADMATVFQEAGAVEIMEAWEQDIEDGKQTDMRMAVKAQAGEKIVFSWIVWPDKASADRCFEQMRENPGPPPEMPFDGKRMIWGGFSPIFTMGREA